MKIENLSDLVDAINYITTTPEEKKIIETEGLAKFKDSIYEVLQYIDNDYPIQSLSPTKKNLFEALQKLDRQERISLSQSMLTSYYTPDFIINSVCDTVNKFIKDSNLTEVKILEPSAGSGKFIPQLQQENRTIDAVELDSLTAKILQNNFSSPSVQIHHVGFESFQSADQYDIIVGNIPFGKYKVYDKDLSAQDQEKINGKIHNYFFHKSIQNLKPGGLLLLVTTASSGNTLDDKPFRESLLNQTNLISCIRFSDSTFKKSATKEVTDLIVLQKPLETKKAENISLREKQFINAVKYNLDDRFFINEYLQSYPENILGELYIGKGYLGKDALSVTQEPNFDYSEKLKNLLKENLRDFGLKQVLDIPIENIKKESKKEDAELIHRNILNVYPYVRPGNVIVEKNTFFTVIKNKEFPNLLDKNFIDVDIKHREKLFAIVEIRESYKRLREAIREKDTLKIKVYQNELEDLYNAYTFFNDGLNSKGNYAILNYEIENDLLKGIEIVENGQYVKSQIFTKDYTSEENLKIKANNIEDAIALSFHNYGRLNENFITEIYQKSWEEWAKEALEKELLYINPIIKNFDEVEGFELAIPSRFNSGYVEGKLAIYKNNSLLTKDNDYYGLLDKNLLDKAKNSLIAVIPFKLNIAEINPGLGEPWIDLKIYELFGKEHFQDDRFSVKHIKAFDKYKAEGGFSKFASSNYSVESNTRNVDYKKIFGFALEHNIPEYTKKIYSGGSIIKVADKETVNAVNLSIEKLNNEFTNWLLSKPDIAQNLENHYHLYNNAIVKENFNISLLNFDQVVGMTPYDHQKNAVWQNINQMGGILDHEVGFGKTLTMAMTTMKKRQFGMINKELVVGLNANYKAIYETYKAAYPEGKFLLVEPDDLAPSAKQNTFYKIANNEWDAVITAHSCLMKFPMAPHSQKAILQEIINDIRATLIQNDESKLFSRKQINDLNKKLLDTEAEYKYATDIINNKKESGDLIFDDLGINSLTIDESHEFKNLEFSTKHSRIAGLGNQSEVQKTRNLLSYVRFVQDQHGGDKGITFASGTTISNSITELFLLFKYLTPTKLNNMNMQTFDQWARVFARKTNEYEESVTGLIKQKERFRYFVKVPELAKMYNDITHYADFNTFKIERPLGVINLIPIEPYKEQLDYFERIKEFGRTKDLACLHNKGVSEGNSISKAVGLICTAEGRKASLSLKMIDPNWPDHPTDKINTMAGIVVEQYHKYNLDKGAQLLFCDQGVPGGTNFNVYQYVKEILINKGIPAEEIAFIHNWDKKKQQLFDKVNSGEIRILLGSTAKMGVGVNVQEKLIAMHHLDYPWRPTDMVQRNGRGERPGNLLLPKFDNQIPIYFYATKQSLDSYTFNLLQIKHNFILQIKNASISTRVVDEGLIDAKGGMNFAEYMAACSSNQYLTKKLEVEKKLNLAIDIQNAAELNHRKGKNRLSFINDDIKKGERIINQLSEDFINTKLITPNKYDDTLFASDKLCATYLREKLSHHLAKNNSKDPLVQLEGNFKLIVMPKVIDFPLDKENYKILLQTPNNYKIGVKANVLTKDDTEVASYTKNCIAKIENLITNEKNKLEDAYKEKEIIEKTLSNKIDKANEIKALKNEIKEIELLIEKENKKNNNEEVLDNSNSKNKGPKL